MAFRLKYFGSRILVGCLLVYVTTLNFARAQEAGADPAADAPEPVHLLCIGNSFAIDATAHLRQIAEADGLRIVIDHAYIGGCSLERHWRHATAFENNPNDPEGRPYGPKDARFSLRERLTSRKWDYVTIQQASILSFRLETYEPYASNLAGYVRKHAPEAELLLHQTWAYEADDPLFAKGEFTQQQMYDRLRDAYRATAEHLGVRLLPVGDAMQLARSTPDWQVGPRDPAYDFDNPIHPNLPKQGPRLTVGYVWRGSGDKRRLELDAHHASLAGRYLGAAVWFEVLFGRSVVGNSYVPNGLTAQQVRQLQEIAHAAVSALDQPAAPAETLVPAQP